MQNVVHTFLSVKTNPETRKSLSFIDFDKIVRYFIPVLNISTFKRKFHSILHIERSEYVFKRRIKPRNPKIANHSMIFTIITRYFPPVYDNTTFKRKIHSILHAECSAYVFQPQSKPRDSQIALIG